jgi:hypothetical protein
MAKYRPFELRHSAKQISRRGLDSILHAPISFQSIGQSAPGSFVLLLIQNRLDNDRGALGRAVCRDHYEVELVVQVES